MQRRCVEHRRDAPTVARRRQGCQRVDGESVQHLDRRARRRFQCRAGLGRVQTLLFAPALAGACGGLDPACARRGRGSCRRRVGSRLTPGHHAIANRALRTGVVNARRPGGTPGRSRCEARAERIDGVEHSATIVRVIAGWIGCRSPTESRARRRMHAAHVSLATAGSVTDKPACERPCSFARRVRRALRRRGRSHAGLCGVGGLRRSSWAAESAAR